MTVAAVEATVATSKKKFVGTGNYRTTYVPFPFGPRRHSGDSRAPHLWQHFSGEGAGISLLRGGSLVDAGVPKTADGREGETEDCARALSASIDDKRSALWSGEDRSFDEPALGGTPKSTGGFPY